MRALIIAIALAAAAAPALAQVERLPETSRAERQTQDINRAITLQEQQTRQNQQTQFEVNQLRNEVQQSRQFPSVTGPVGSCPAGSIC
jgi:hypothetical protein